MQRNDEVRLTSHLQYASRLLMHCYPASTCTQDRAFARLRRCTTYNAGQPPSDEKRHQCRTFAALP